jgi:hypothetical protein
MITNDLDTIQRRLLKMIGAVALLLSISLLLPGASHAQDMQDIASSDEKRFEFGVEVGGSLVSLAYDQPWEEWDPGRRLSYHASISAYYDVARPLTLESGIRFVRLGNDVEVDFPDIQGQPSGDGSFQIEQLYLTIPLLPHIHLPIPRSKRLSIFAGPEVGYLLNARGVSTLDNPQPNEQANQTSNITDNLKRFHLALQVGMQYRFPVGSVAALLRSSYGRGLIDPTIDEDWAVSWQTREIAVGVGLLF